MRSHHGQLGVGGGDGVEPDRPGVVECDALTAGLAGADPAGPGVEQREQPVPLAGGEDRPVGLIIRGERLQRRVELDPAQTQRGDVRHLGDGGLALVRVDGAEPGEHIGMIAAGGRHGLVGHPRAPGRGLGVPRQQHRHRLEPAVRLGQVRDGQPLHR
jgi:hypothetical protein